jgi:aldehyde:ferredoxin oxidoreductase
MLSSVDRISLGGKSPLTGGAKEANAGGNTGMRMVWLQIFALIVEGGRPKDGEWRLLYIGEDGVRLEEADQLVGLDLKDLSNILLERYNFKIGLSAIGTAGERLYRAAGITHIDKDRNLTRISARGGLGAVMGSKHLKAVVFNLPKAHRPKVIDKQLFETASKRYLKALREHPQTSNTFTHYGTAAMVNLANILYAMPTRNFTKGRFDNAEIISGEAIR